MFEGFRKMKIRKAVIKDGKVLLEIYLGEHFLHGGGKDTYDLENISDYIRNKNNRFFICEDKGKIIGALYAEFFSEYVYLHTIVVIKRFRRVGIALALLDRLEEEMKKGKQNFIEAFTEDKNVIMQKLFKKRKYQKGRTFYYYCKGL